MKEYYPILDSTGAIFFYKSKENSIAKKVMNN